MGIIRRQHSGGDYRTFTATGMGGGGGGGGGRRVVIRIVQSLPTHPQTLNDYRSVNPTRYQSEKNILHS